jgi:Alcohol dehydrogenase GroES-like domain/Alcohol dehydrogenase GroES-associated
MNDLGPGAVKTKCCQAGRSWDSPTAIPESAVLTERTPVQRTFTRFSKSQADRQAGPHEVLHSNLEVLMRALCWHGKGDVRVDTVPDPTIQHPRDAVIRITACAICGSDLHLYDGYQPTMESGDILGHENMGEVVALGSEVTNLRIGDRVVVPFTISCGQCWFCTKGLFSACERTNPNAAMAVKAMGHSPAGLFGFSHMLGGYSGGQAEYLRTHKDPRYRDG